MDIPENNDLKEKLTREKIKKELLYLHWRSVLSVVLIPLIFITEYILCYFLDIIDRIDLPVRIIAWALYLLIAANLIVDLVCIIRIKNDKFHVVKDILVKKEKFITSDEEVDMETRNVVHSRFGTYRGYTLVFSKFKWAIPDYNYRWSEFYGVMRVAEVYGKSEVTDWFYIAYSCKPGILTAFNTKFFEYTDVCDEDFTGNKNH